MKNDWYRQAYVPKIQEILNDNGQFLNDVKKEDEDVIQISSYMPIKNEMNIVPVMNDILNSSDQH